MASRNSAARNDSAPLEPRSWSQEWIAPDDEPELPGSGRATRGRGSAGGSGKTARGAARAGAPATEATPQPIKAIVAEPAPATRPPAVEAETTASPGVAMPVIPVAAEEPPVAAEAPPVAAEEPPVAAVEPPVAAEEPPVAAAAPTEAPVPATAPAPPPAPVAPAGDVPAEEFPFGDRGQPTGTTVQRHRAWLRLLDSRVIGTALAAVLLVIAAELLQTPGASADIRELPGQVSGAIQSVVAQPEPGYPRIRIKRVGIDLMLVKGDGNTPPVKYEAFTYPLADHVLAEPGTTGNTYVYAHARTGMFWSLHDVNIGDTIEIDYGGGKVGRYRVSEIHKSVSWKDFEWLQPTSDDRLTLQTCNGWRDEDPRYVVVAHRVADTNTALAR